MRGPELVECELLLLALKHLFEQKPTVGLVSSASIVAYLDKIAAQLAELQQQGVRMEACSVATRLFKLDNDSLIEGIKPVGNTFVSLTGYQAQGYVNIPIY